MKELLTQMIEEINGGAKSRDDLFYTVNKRLNGFIDFSGIGDRYLKLIGWLVKQNRSLAINGDVIPSVIKAKVPEPGKEKFVSVAGDQIVEICRLSGSIRCKSGTIVLVDNPGAYKIGDHLVADCLYVRRTSGLIVSSIGRPIKICRNGRNLNIKPNRTFI